MINHILQIRSQCFQNIRRHFLDSGALEVDTPLLTPFTVTDPYMSAMQAQNPQGNKLGFLQTSPEYSMKKLLCAGSGDIFQLSKVFRADESSPCHSNEFTMLEWYRLNYSLPQLMDEVFQIITLIGGHYPRTDLSYREAFLRFLNIDPFNISLNDLADLSKKQLGELPDNMLFDNYLTLLFSTLVEPQFSHDHVTFIYDFPANQASLARKQSREYAEVACRFEAYCGGLELANGFYELGDAEEQLARFKADNQIRHDLGYPAVEIDHDLIVALEKGLPDCSGVAVGFDRLLMLKLKQKDIRDVLPMSFAS
ncbi:EF-P lysine aminoacylase EpmA [Aliikangiella sp. IMCC44359]|uniref:EF-P lysine aminoacylase EpmA n=1 Tax=Aliikangiella sp. IMCC44359 TaxID=3459125 RepID=UPI00403AE259